MATPYIGEIRLFAGNFAPNGWLRCDGSHLPISEYETLFQLIGTIYGGDGEATFAVPDLRGRVPMHRRTTGEVGAARGQEEVTLTTGQLPIHTHTPLASTAIGNDPNPAGNVLAESSVVAGYSSSDPSTAMRAGAIVPVGGSQPHDNLQPYTVITFIIAWAGLFPSPT